MAEQLTVDDVEAYTEGRLLASDPETQRMLDAALSRARLWCGWHVTPVLTETLILDRPDSHILILPTMKIVTLTSIEVDGTVVDLSEVRYSREAPGCLARADNTCWSTAWGTNGFGEIEVTLAHGYTAAEAGAFREAVLQMVDAAALSIGTGGIGPLTGKRVDDVELHWSGFVDRSWGIAKQPMNESVMYQYRLLPFV